MEVNDHILAVSGKASTLEPLENGQDYTVTITGEVRTTSDSINDDGTINRTYRFKPRTIDNLVHEGKTIKVKDKNSTSQKNRAVHEFWKLEHSSPLTYEEVWQRIRSNYGMVMDFLYGNK